MFQILLQNSPIVRNKLQRLLDSLQAQQYNFISQVSRHQEYLGTLDTEIGKLDDYIKILNT